jgi:hypothetical protein
VSAGAGGRGAEALRIGELEQLRDPRPAGCTRSYAYAVMAL